MKRTRRRIQQLLVSMLAVVSLSVSTIAACSCSHHEPVVETKKSCHGPVESTDHQPPKADTGPSVAEICICAQPPVNVSVKAEVFKLKKQPTVGAGITTLVPVTLYTASVASDFGNDIPLHEEPLFVSKSVRGPPVS